MPENNDRPESPFLVERLMREARLKMEDTEFVSEDEFRASLPDLVDDGLQAQRLESLRDNPEELAQEFAFEAYESGDAETALELVDKALLVDPDCVDALTVRAFLTIDDAGELVSALEHAATCGEKRLGEEFFSEFMGDFWPMVEARPYMRTIKQLAEVLWTIGRRFDAVAHYENLLDLDPADHMGNSTLLLGYYLSMGEVQRSWDLLEEHDDESSAVFAWAWVLLFLLNGDEDGARDALEHALAGNPHVAPLLVGLGPDSEEESLPPYVKVGSEQEAQLCVQILGEAWEHNPMAQMWLHGQLVDMGLINLDHKDDSPGDQQTH
jgi:tetratricopeptide (TPR) repeat protein